MVARTLLCLLGAISVASASIVKGEFVLIVDAKAKSFPSNANLIRDTKAALSSCFTYKNADGTPKTVSGTAGGQTCAAAALDGISVSVAADTTVPNEVYQTLYECDDVGPYPGPCGTQDKLQLRKVSFTINSPFVDGDRAKSAGQNSDMMTAGFLDLLKTARDSQQYDCQVYNYKITQIVATKSEQCNMPLAIGTDAAANAAKEATNDWRAGPDDGKLTAGEIFGIILGVLALCAGVAVAAVMIQRRVAGGSLSGEGSSEMTSIQGP